MTDYNDNEAYQTQTDEQREDDRLLRECPETGQIITVKQAAEMLAVSGMTIRRLINMGKLPAWRIAGDGAIRLNSLDVEAMRIPVFPPEEREAQQ